MVYDGDLEDALHWYLYKSSSGMLLGRSSETLYIDYIEGPCLTRFGNSRRCPGMRFWYEVMSRHSVASCAHASSCCSYDHVQTYYILLLGSHPAATIILLHQSTYHSCSTATACTWYIDFLWLPTQTAPGRVSPSDARWPSPLDNGGSPGLQNIQPWCWSAGSLGRLLCQVGWTML